MNLNWFSLKKKFSTRNENVYLFSRYNINILIIYWISEFVYNITFSNVNIIEVFIKIENFLATMFIFRKFEECHISKNEW